MTGRLAGLGLALWLCGSLPARADPADGLDPATRQYYDTAVQAEAEGRWKRAATAWRLVLGRDPAFSPAALGLARCLKEQGDTAGAIRMYEDMPTEPDAVEALAALVEAEDPARAAELYRRLTTLRLGDPDPHRLLTRSLCRVDPQQAQVELRMWLGLVQGEPDGELVMEVALALREAGLEEQSGAVLGEYLAAWPEGAWAHEARGRLDRLAVEAAARELAVGSSQPLTAAQRAQVDQARRRAAQGQLEPALAELREVVQAAPRSAEAWGALGDVHQKLDRVDEAERAYTWATALAPEEASWQARLGLLLAERYGGRRHREADELLGRALALRPTWAELSYRRGRVRQELGDFAAAVESYTAYLEAEADGPWAAEARQRLVDLGRQAPAPADLPAQPGPPADLPDEAVTRYRIARVYWDQGELAASQAELDQALAQAPDWAAALNLQAALQMQRGDEAAAVASWQRSLASDPAQPLVRLNLGQRLRQEGQRSAARALLQEAAEAGAEDAWYLLALMAWEDHALLEARRNLERYEAVATGGISQEAARGLARRVEERIRVIRSVVSVALGAAVLGLAGLVLRRSTGRPLADLVAKAPELSHDLARLLSAIRHEVLKHNTTLLDEVALALENGDHHAVRWAALRLFGARGGGPGGGERGVISRFEDYLAAIERLGRKHGIRLDLRRKDPTLAPMWQAMVRLRRLEGRLRRPQRAGAAAAAAELRQISLRLNDEGYRALGRLVREMGTLRLETRHLEEVDARVRAEPAFGTADLPGLELSGPEGAVPVRVFRGDLEDIVANLLRNAYLAVLEGVAPGMRRVGLVLREEDDPITGIEHLALEFRDNAPGRLTDAMIRGRSIGRGLGLAVDLITRHDGSIHVEAPSGGPEALHQWTKAVVVRLPRAEEGDEG